MPTVEKKTIAELNDQLRRTFRGGKILLTEAVQALDMVTRMELLLAVQKFETFTQDNDPHNEHDFGLIKLDGKTFYFKVDYYDLNYEWRSENPADPALTRRVLTIMENFEY
jgi:Protein of unknown function (DUF3768)